MDPGRKGPPPYAAIVEECFPESALTDPFAFFDAVGDPAKFKANLDRMIVLARAGDGLNQFINRAVKKRYSERLA